MQRVVREGHSTRWSSAQRPDAADGTELRPEIFAMARDRGWTLWELHREKASLEQLFRSLTADDGSTAESGEGDR